MNVQNDAAAGATPTEATIVNSRRQNYSFASYRIVRQVAILNCDVRTLDRD